MLSPASKQLTKQVMEKVQMDTPLSSVNIWSWAESFSVSESVSVQDNNTWVCKCAQLVLHTNMICVCVHVGYCMHSRGMCKDASVCARGTETASGQMLKLS